MIAGFCFLDKTPIYTPIFLQKVSDPINGGDKNIDVRLHESYPTAK